MTVPVLQGAGATEMQMRMRRRFLAIAAACLVLGSAAAAAGDSRIRGWISEPGVDPPSYAVTEPTAGNLNVDTVLLLCTELGRQRSLELDLYLTDDGPLLPQGAAPRDLKDDPRVEIAIDGGTFPARLMFADDYVVVADSQIGQLPSLSNRLLDAMERGERMTLRFDLLAEPTGPARFDSEIVVDLVAGRSAIAGVRRCAKLGALHQVSNAMSNASDTR
jgi:hypothetical protein